MAYNIEQKNKTEHDRYLFIPYCPQPLQETHFNHPTRDVSTPVNALGADLKGVNAHSEHRPPGESIIFKQSSLVDSVRE